MNQEPQKGWREAFDEKFGLFHVGAPSNYGTAGTYWPREMVIDFIEKTLTSEREVILKGVDKALRGNVEDGKVELICQNIRDSLKK